jgi:MoxR-like ATPase
VTISPTTASPGGHAGHPLVATSAALRQGLAQAGYLADDETCHVVSLAARLGKPVLVEGPAGTGKTQLAKSLAQSLGSPLIRLQCYEGLDEPRALFEWDYRKQLLWIQAARVGDALAAAGPDAVADTVFSERFLLERPLLRAIRTTEPSVLLIDEVDRVDVETEALFLEVLAERQVSVPEIGTITAATIPLVILTSNGTRELSEALKRRCFYLYLDYPSAEREADIVLVHVPELQLQLARQVAELVAALRRMDLRKKPSVSETVDVAQVLALLKAADLDERTREECLNILLKHRGDLEAARTALSVPAR